jgi:hypothetical protein
MVAHHSAQIVAKAFPKLFARGLITVEAPGEDPSATHNRERNKLLQRALRADRRAKGLCVKCGGAKLPELTLCEECRDKQNNAQRANRGTIICSGA